MKVVIFAANGYVGRVLVHHYSLQQAEVVAVSRRPFPVPSGVIQVRWDGKNYEETWASHLDDADLVVNLAGKSVNCRYNEGNKQEIIDSRIFAVKAIAKAIQQCGTPPKVWVNAASATIYRHAEDRPMDELTGEIGSGFSVEVCKKWESTFLESVTPDTRKIALRMAIVLGKEDGVFVRLQNLVRWGLGSKQGNGKQMFSWIHEYDLCRLIDFVYQHEDLQGVYNASAPYPESNDRVMFLIRKAMHMPLGLPAPRLLLELGALLIGTETELILKSRWVLPTKLLQAGFQFRHPSLQEAIGEIVSGQA